MNDKKHEIIYNFFYELLGFDSDLIIDMNDEEVFVNVQVDSEYSGTLIGYRGEVLTSIQLILGLILNRNEELWLPVRVNINDYREQREKSLENLANNAANNALNSGQEVQIPNLSSYERRIIHSFLTTRDDVVTFSQGESPNRVLVVSPAEVAPITI